MGKAIVALTRKVGTFSNANMVVFQTHIQAVEGLLDGSGLIDMALLPTSLKIGLKPIGGISYAASVMDSFNDIWAHAGTFDSGDGVMEGHYVNIDIGGTFSVEAGHIITNGDDGGGSLTGGAGITIALEKNDWLVYQGLDGSLNKTWQIMNHTYPNATTSAAGLMSAADKTKLDGLSTHPTGGANVDLTFTGLQKLATLTVNTLGHVTAATLEAIQSGSESQAGVLQLATQAEVRSATVLSTKPVSKERVADVVKFIQAIKIYDGQATEAGNLSDANASLEHGEGALVLIKVGEVTV